MFKLLKLCGVTACRPTTMNLACVTLGMTMEEALVASTINAAAALGVGDSRGSLEVSDP